MFAVAACAPGRTHMRRGAAISELDGDARDALLHASGQASNAHGNGPCARCCGSATGSLSADRWASEGVIPDRLRIERRLPWRRGNASREDTAGDPFQAKAGKARLFCDRSGDPPAPSPLTLAKRGLQSAFSTQDTGTVRWHRKLWASASAWCGPLLRCMPHAACGRPPTVTTCRT